MAFRTRPWALLILTALGSCAPLPRGTALEPDPARDAQEAVDLLRELIRFDTINPPQPGSGKKNADETALLRHVKGVLAADGIVAEIYEREPGRGNLVARVKGTGEKRPLLLMAHVDVVNVDPSQWDVNPLAGELRDGFVWGRGALDDKSGVIGLCVCGALAQYDKGTLGALEHIERAFDGIRSRNLCRRRIDHFDQ